MFQRERIAYKEGDLGLLFWVDEMDGGKRLEVGLDTSVGTFFVSFFVPDLDRAKLPDKRSFSTVVTRLDSEVVVTVELHTDVLVNVYCDLIQASILVKLAIAVDCYILGSGSDGLLFKG